MKTSQLLDVVGVVAIGRNEGQRLVNCLDSIKEQTDKIVYVDSGSTDQSVEMAKSRMIEVVSLDMRIPFTAARARNIGFSRLVEMYPDLQYVQFVDGDCQVNPDWLSLATDFLDTHNDVAVVCGRRKEMYPEKSLYNQLCDIEWNTPIGEAKACGGDALMRVDVLKQAGGYLEMMIAGEEPELCLRIKRLGWKIWRLDANMTLHDAAMTKFAQWWKRTVRAGYAFALGAHLHGRAPERHWVAESNRAWLWGGIIPLLIVLCLMIKPLLALILLALYPLQILKLTFKSHLPLQLAFAQATLLVIGKFAEFTGKLRFLWQLYTKKSGKLIEYK